LSTPRSRKAQEYTAIGASVGVSIVPLLLKATRVAKGIDIFGIVSMIVDLYDPYGYISTMTREGINEEVAMIVDIFKKELSNPEIKVMIAQTLDDEFKNYNLDLPEERKTILVEDIFLDTLKGFSIAKPEPVPKECFSQQLLMTGPPTDQCGTVYTSDYNDFNEKNKSIYMAAKEGQQKVIEEIFITNKPEIEQEVADIRSKLIPIVVVIAMLIALLFI
jgi:hypothetical protein